MKKLIFLLLILVTLTACSDDVKVAPTSWTISTSTGDVLDGVIELGVRVGTNWWFEDHLDVLLMNEVQVMYVNEGMITDFGTISLPENEALNLRPNTDYFLDLDLTQFFQDEFPQEGDFKVIFNLFFNGMEHHPEIEFSL